MHAEMHAEIRIKAHAEMRIERARTDHLGRRFPDRKGLAVSIYFLSFGGGLLVASELMTRLLPIFRRAPERIGSISEARTARPQRAAQSARP